MAESPNEGGNGTDRWGFMTKLGSASCSNWRPTVYRVTGVDRAGGDAVRFLHCCVAQNRAGRVERGWAGCREVKAFFSSVLSSRQSSFCIVGKSGRVVSFYLLSIQN